MSQIRSQSFDVYAARCGRSEREIARRAYPHLTAGAAQQRLRRRRAHPSIEVDDGEAVRLAEAVDAKADWLDSPVCWVLEDDARESVIVGGGVFLFWTSDGAHWAAERLSTSIPGPLAPLYAGSPRPSKVTLSEAQSWLYWPVLNIRGDLEDQDGFSVYLDIDLAIRGKQPKTPQIWRDLHVSNVWTEHLLHAAHTFAVLRWAAERRGDRDVAAAWEERFDGVAAIIGIRIEALRSYMLSRPYMPPDRFNHSRVW